MTERGMAAYTRVGLVLGVVLGAALIAICLQTPQEARRTAFGFWVVYWLIWLAVGTVLDLLRRHEESR